MPSNLQNNFKKTLLEDALSHWQDKLRPVGLTKTLHEIKDQDFDFIFTNYLAVGYTRDLFKSLNWGNTKVLRIANSYYLKAWPYATHGFFRFKDQI